MRYDADRARTRNEDLNIILILVRSSYLLKVPHLTDPHRRRIYSLVASLVAALMAMFLKQRLNKYLLPVRGP